MSVGSYPSLSSSSSEDSYLTLELVFIGICIFSSNISGSSYRNAGPNASSSVWPVKLALTIVSFGVVSSSFFTILVVQAGISGPFPRPRPRPRPPRKPWPRPPLNAGWLGGFSMNAYPCFHALLLRTWVRSVSPKVILLFGHPLFTTLFFRIDMARVLLLVQIALKQLQHTFAFPTIFWTSGISYTTCVESLTIIGSTTFKISSFLSLSSFSFTIWFFHSSKNSFFASSVTTPVVLFL